LPASFADNLALFVFASAVLEKILQLFCAFVSQNAAGNFQPVIQPFVCHDVIQAFYRACFRVIAAIDQFVHSAQN
jgi:hypothetical protein